VDNLPCELPKESSKYFSNCLLNYVHSIVKTDYSVDFENLKFLVIFVKIRFKSLQSEISEY